MTRHRQQWLRVLLVVVALPASVSGQTLSSRSELPPQPLNHPQELLQWFDIDKQRLAMFVDGRPLNSTEEETLWALLFRLPRLPLSDFTRWTQDAPPLTTLATLPAEHRADAVLLRGRAVHVTRLELPAETAQRLEFDHCFRVVVRFDSGPQVAAVFVRKIPASWPVEGLLDEPVSALALFLKTSADEEGHPELLFAADHLAWHPDSVAKSTGLSDDHVYLAAHGMDVGLFDDVRDGNRQYIEASERECFYQLLAAVGRLDAAGLRQRATSPVDLVALLQQTEKQHGRLFRVRGTARRVFEIRVDDPEIRQRLGLDHYYQIDLFLPLDKQIVRSGAADDPDRRVFTNSYPVTVCVLRLPPQLPVSSDCQEEVVIPAAFWKLWAYQSRFVSEHDRHDVQVSPLFMGLEPLVLASPQPSDSTARWVVAFVFLGVLGGVWWWLWSSSRSDGKVDQQLRRRRHQVASGQSLNDAGISTRDETQSSGKGT